MGWYLLEVDSFSVSSFDLLMKLPTLAAVTVDCGMPLVMFSFSRAVDTHHRNYTEILICSAPAKGWTKESCSLVYHFL